MGIGADGAAKSTAAARTTAIAALFLPATFLTSRLYALTGMSPSRSTVAGLGSMDGLAMAYQSIPVKGSKVVSLANYPPHTRPGHTRCAQCRDGLTVWGSCGYSLYTGRVLAFHGS